MTLEEIIKGYHLIKTENNGRLPYEMQKSINSEMLDLINKTIDPALKKLAIITQDTSDAHSNGLKNLHDAVDPYLNVIGDDLSKDVKKALDFRFNLLKDFVKASAKFSREVDHLVEPTLK